MQLMQPFDATQHNPTQGTPQMPVGKHPVVIVDSEIKSTSDNESGMLVLTLEIIDGPSKGVQGAYRLNLYNKSQQACDIANRQLSAICHCIGIFSVADSAQLHNKPFIVEAGLQKDKEAAEKGYTEIKRVFDINGNEPGKQTTGQAAQPVAAQQQQPAANAGWGKPATPAQEQPAAQQPAAQPAWGAQPGQVAQTQQPAATTQRPAWAR